MPIHEQSNSTRSRQWMWPAVVVGAVALGVLAFGARYLIYRSTNAGERARLDAGSPDAPPPTSRRMTADGVHVQIVRGGIAGSQVQFDVLVWAAADTKSLPFREWSSSEPGPKLTDEIGNTYPLIRVKPSSVPRGYTAAEWARSNGGSPKEVEVGDGRITSDVGRADELVFAAPAPAAKTLTLELPRDNVGGSGVAKFVIDVGAVRDRTGEWARPAVEIGVPPRRRPAPE